MQRAGTVAVGWRAGATLALAILVGWATGCHPKGSPSAADTRAAVVGAAPGDSGDAAPPVTGTSRRIALGTLSPSLASVQREPDVRVRVMPDATSARFDGAPGYHVDAGPGAAPINVGAVSSPVTITRRGEDFIIQKQDGSTKAVRTSSLRIMPVYQAVFRVNGRVYPDAAVLSTADASPGRFDVINYVSLEDYLPGVLDRELYKSWAPETFRAQAIAARSYALAQMSKWHERSFDMEASQASQAYSGETSNRMALDAVHATRGMVLTYNGRVVPAYYSACCGGKGQDANIAIPEAPGIPPLTGKSQDGYCTASPQYSWGSVKRSKADLQTRLVLWGRANQNAIARLHGLNNIAVSGDNHAGRPAQFVVIDDAGQRFTLGPEQLRFAANYEGGGAGSLPASQVLKSSNCEVSVSGGTVNFYNGHGFGHGAGLCQWGAQGMASRGANAATILNFYYPGATIERAYSEVASR